MAPPARGSPGVRRPPDRTMRPASQAQDGTARTSAGLRNKHRSDVLRLLLSTGPLSRPDLTSRTGLTAASITRIVRELIDSGVLVEVGAPDGQRIGRPGTLVNLNAEHACVAAVYLGGRW